LQVLFSPLFPEGVFHFGQESPVHQRYLLNRRYCVPERPDFGEVNELIQVLEVGVLFDSGGDASVGGVELRVVPLGVQVHQPQAHHLGLQVRRRQLLTTVFIEEGEHREALLGLGEVVDEEIIACG